MANWKIDYLEDGGIVLVKMLGPAGFEDTKQICIEANAVAREHQSRRYLIDHRGVEMALSVPDIDEVPDAFRKIGADFEGKTAILLDPAAPGSDKFGFLKDVLAKSWMHFELFTDEDEALAWLKEV
jgi:hypothetical protein